MGVARGLRPPRSDHDVKLQGLSWMGRDKYQTKCQLLGMTERRRFKRRSHSALRFTHPLLSSCHSPPACLGGRTCLLGISHILWIFSNYHPFAPLARLKQSMRSKDAQRGRPSHAAPGAPPTQPLASLPRTRCSSDAAPTQPVHTRHAAAPRRPSRRRARGSGLQPPQSGARRPVR